MVEVLNGMQDETGGCEAKLVYVEEMGRGEVKRLQRKHYSG